MHRLPLGYSACLILLSALASSSANGQYAVALATGARVRVQTLSQPNEWHVGNVASIDSTSVTLAGKRINAIGGVDSYAQPYVASLSTVQQLEVSRGRYKRMERGVIGALLGAAIGTVTIGAAGWSLTQCSNCEESGIGVLAGVFLGPPIGGIFGAMVGVAHAPERWEPVPFRSVQRAPAP